MDLIRALFHKRYDKDEKTLKSLTTTTFEGKTIVKSDVLFASDEFKRAEKLIAGYDECPGESADRQ